MMNLQPVSMMNLPPLSTMNLPTSGIMNLPPARVAEVAASVISNGNSANNVPGHGLPGFDVMDWINTSSV